MQAPARLRSPPAFRAVPGLWHAARTRPYPYSWPMPKERNEIRDPVHVFVMADPDELGVVDSRPFQRLRNIHQLSLTYLIYPGATHKRFEHSLGVMHLAGQIYDTVTRQENLSDALREIVPTSARKLEYWRSVVRMAALCHDLGHLPFSHGPESLLPGGTTHEQISRTLIESEEMRSVWASMRPEPKIEDVVKVALGPKKAGDLAFETWDGILAEMIVGDAFGADRMDYLLRDSLHAGVSYGRFDHHRLIQSMRILPPVREPKDEDGAVTLEEAQRSSLGVMRGGLESAEALLVARYFMYSQVYNHETRLINDIHLRDFLELWLKDKGGYLPVDPEGFLALTDSEIVSAIAKSARDSADVAHEPAWRIANRKHYRVFYERGPEDVALYPKAASAIFEAAKGEFGEDHVRFGSSRKPPGDSEFPVRDRDGRSVSSSAMSPMLQGLPEARAEFVYVVRDKRNDAEKWVRDNKQSIIEAAAAKESETES
jgi:HD superfamily phosphohydrolase